jgi:hypothetical protein
MIQMDGKVMVVSVVTPMVIAETHSEGLNENARPSNS